MILLLLFLCGNLLTASAQTYHPPGGVAQEGPITRLDFLDDFCGGLTGTGDIGEKGWTAVSTPTIDTQNGELNHPCVVTVSSTASLNDVASIELRPGGGSGRVAFDPAGVFSYTAIVYPTTTTVQKIQIGVTDTALALTPVNGIYFEHDTAAAGGSQTKWRCVTRASDTETQTDSTVTVTSAWTKLQIRRAGTSIIFAINGVDECTHTTNVPTSLLTLSVGVKTLETVIKTIGVDVIRYLQTNIVR